MTLRMSQTLEAVRIAFCAAALCIVLGAPTARAQDTQPEGDPFGHFDRKSGAGERRIGPGKVQLAITPDGQWQSFEPVWGEGESLFESGGFFVFAADEDGAEVILNTAIGDGDRGGRFLGKYCEGISGGFRAPSPNPDDDRDGRTNEDRCDGVDNDGDGTVDEDFAAIGDEMIVSEYASSNATLRIHQETYAWSLPHIDGAVMMALWIRNAGEETLHDVCLGAVLGKRGSFLYTDRTIDVEGPGVDSGAFRARTVICSERTGASVAMVFFPMEGFGAWTSGFGESRDVEVVLLGRAGVGHAASDFVGPEPVDHDRAYVSDFATVYGMSPVVAQLAPGEEVRIDLALVAVRDRGKIDEALQNTVKTYLGDGDNRYLPPTVSMTPRTLWGVYRPLEDEQAIVVEFEALGRDPVTADRISYVSGISAGSVEARELRPGNTELVIRGEFADEVLKKNGRVTIKGRLDTGEFFDALLRPAEGSSVMASSREAELFWKTPGRIEQELLDGSPNPFRESTTITYEIPTEIERADGTFIENNDDALRTSVKVYNVTGRLVAVLEDNQLSPGVYSALWNAADDQGNHVASGVYYVKLQIEKKYMTKRLVLLK